MSKKIRYETVGGIEFNDNRLYDDLEERCHMVYTVNGDTYRCCDQHTIQLKLSNDFKNNKFIKR